jgi:hypothetical protein
MIRLEIFIDTKLILFSFLRHSILSFSAGSLSANHFTWIDRWFLEGLEKVKVSIHNQFPRRLDFPLNLEDLFCLVYTMERR